MISSVQVHEKHRNVIVVTDESGAQFSYLMNNGVLEAGQVWMAMAPGGERVSFFLPFPDRGPVAVLEVEAQ
jgi:hypothetical protein